MSGTKVLKKNTVGKLSVKVQTLATVAAIVAAVALPQIFHAIGAVSGYATVPGETFLPMHLPIIIVGLLAGPYAGAISGFIAPAVSFALSGMPTSAMLPFMMIELCAYGLFSGLLRNVKMPAVLKVLVTQVAGRVLRSAAVLTAVYALGNETLKVSSIWMSIVKGFPGIIIQLVLIPLVIYRVNGMKKNEK